MNLTQQYADALAAQLGRPADEIRREGLRAGDFPYTLNFQFEDGSHATFHHALFIHDPLRWAIVVFTEHCGYFVFPDVVRISAENVGVLFDDLG